ncbi:MAG: aldo/keto reductase [Rhodocyclales bacterium]|nr:aldo/keto reductase [Rhodocyclales bacterium]
MPSRRRFLHHSLALSGLGMMPSLACAATPASRVIPADGRRLAVVGLGTWQTFDVGTDAAARDNLGRLLSRFVELGGELIDSSPMYGSAESVVGDLAGARKLRDRLFLATKVWTSGRDAGIAQMEESLRRLKSPRIELMQIHNLKDWKLHLPVLRAWKAEGRIRHIGITHFSPGAYAEIEDILRTEPLDFLQINYSLAEQESARHLLPLAAARGVAVIANRPFAEGALFGRVKDRTLPAAAADHGCRSWAQLFLRWILAHPAVTCAIPASNRIEHLEDNMAAGMGALPGFEEQKALARMAGF